MAITVKFKILKYTPDHCLVINFYTDALYEAMKPEWARRVQQLVTENPGMTNEEALAKAQEERWPGGIWSYNIYQDPAPTGQALIDYISSLAPTQWLEWKERVTLNPPVDHIEEHILPLVGQEIVATPKITENGPAIPTA